jgi:hypothetical protein
VEMLEIDVERMKVEVEVEELDVLPVLELLVDSGPGALVTPGS